MRWFFRLCVGVCLALAPCVASAQHTLNAFTSSFEDLDQDGVIDCGERVTIAVGVFDNTALPPTVVTGRLIVPAGSPAGWSFEVGSVFVDPTFRVRCQATIVQGNAASDPQAAVVDYTCTPATPPNDGYTLLVFVTGVYLGPSGPILIPLRDERLTPAPAVTTNRTHGEDNVEGCLNADLSISKTDNGVSVSPGGTVVYTLSVANVGNTPAVNTRISEITPPGTSFDAAASSPGWSCSAGLCTLILGNLPDGGSASRTFALRVNVPSSLTSIDNVAVVSTDSADTNPANNTATDSTPVLPGSPDLALAKTITTPGASPGDTLIYTLTATNTGNATAAGVTLTDTLPSGVTFLPGSSSSGWTCAATCTLSLGSLAPGASASRTLAVRLASPSPQGLTSLTNNACVATSTPGDPSANNCASVTSPVNAAPRLDVQKTLTSGSPTSGATLTYTLSVTNLGDRDAGTVTLSETVPPNSTFSAAASSPGWACSGTAPGSTCSLTIPSLAGGGGSTTRTFAIVLASPFPPSTSLTNTACAATSGSAQVCDDIVVQSGAPNLSLAKTLQTGTATPGGTLVYLLTIQNTGTTASLPTLLSETLPAHTTFHAGSSSPGWSCAAGTCSLTLPAVAAGDSVARTFGVTLADPLPAGVTSIRNTACLDAPSGPDLCDELDIPTQAGPVLSILKEHVSGTAQPGNLITYRITVGNTGNQVASGLSITDVIPAHTTLAPANTHADWICPATAAGTTCTWTIASLSPGTTLSRDFAVTVNADAPTTGLLANTSCLGQACSSVDLPRSGPPTPPTISIAKSFAGPPLTAGALLTFELALTNHGTAPAANLTLTETVPAHSTFQPIASSPGWSCSAPTAGASCTLAVPTLAPGTSTFTFSVRAADPLPQGVTQIANSACVQSPSGTDCADSNTPLQQFLEADLVDLVDDANSNQTLDPGEHLAYTLTVTNPSSGAARDVVITLPLDPHLALVPGSVITSAGTVVSGNNPADTVAVVQVPSLAPGETVTLTLDSIAHDLAGVTEVASQANVAGSNIQDEPSNDPDTADLDDDPTRTPIRLTDSVLAIPTLDQLGLVALVLLLAVAAFIALRRGKAAQSV